MRKQVWMFSGQGSQFPAMGRKLYEQRKVFRHELSALDAVAREHAGVSILDMLYGTRADSSALERTLFSHPTIFAVQYALARTLLAEGVRPVAMLGMSLGEFVAAAVCGVAPVSDMLRFVLDKAVALERHCEPGFMLAVLAPSSVFDEEGLARFGADMVGVNYAGHFVVGGHRSSLTDVEAQLSSRRILFQRLPVSFGFHTRNLDPAIAALRARELTLGARGVGDGWVSCVTGGFVSNLSPTFFTEVARGPILFADAVRAVEARYRADGIEWVDVGPSGTLSNFIKNQRSPSPSTLALMTPYGNEDVTLDKFLARARRAAASPIIEGQTVMKAYMFPGQGSQSVGMGADIFDAFSALVREANDILGYDVAELCLRDTQGLLGRTEYTQPALYVVNALSYLARRQVEGNADFLIGHSLGEYSALFAGEAFSFGDGLRIVRKRGELMSAARDGGMAAVIGLDESQVRAVLSVPGFEQIDIANLNARTQVVISGPADSIRAAQAAFERAGSQSYIMLNVSGAFHSRMMRDAQRDFASFVREIRIDDPRLPVVSNVSARPHVPGGVAASLVEQIASPVRWTESIDYLAGAGVSTFEEIGPGRVLTGLVRRILSAPTPSASSGTSVSLGVAPSAPPAALSPKPPSPTPDLAVVASVPSPAPAMATPAKPALDGPAPMASPVRPLVTKITVDRLGCADFKARYGLKYPYMTGGMVHGIASVKVVVAMARAGMMGFFGTGGLDLGRIALAIAEIRAALGNGLPFGMNLLPGAKEEATVDLYLAEDVRIVEAAAYMQVTPALARFKLAGLSFDEKGMLRSDHRIVAKVSRVEVATQFLSPIPEPMLQRFLRERLIDERQAVAARKMPLADDLCIEADSGGHTDMGNLSSLLPAMQRIRSDLARQFGYEQKVGIGAAGGIGTPEAAAAAFVLGADFVVTGSINQCTVEAATSSTVKDMLQQAEVRDTGYAPAGDMFEIGAKVQVLKRGVFFPARANKLYELYTQHESIADLSHDLRNRLEDKYFGKSMEAIFDDCRAFYPAADIERAEAYPKQKMAYVFRWYFGRSMRWALAGEEANKVNFQIQCGPALGAFNQWMRSTPLEDWRSRHVDDIGMRIVEGAADWLDRKFSAMSRT